MFEIKCDGVCSRVLDGDTVDIVVARTVRVRLLDLWCPETRSVRGTTPETKAAGIRAREFLAARIEGKPVSFRVPIDAGARFGESMSFGRVLAYVEHVGDDVSRLMVDAGHGTKTKGG